MLYELVDANLSQFLHDIQQCISIILFFNIHHSQPKLAKKSESNQFKYVIIIIAQAYLITFFTYLFSLFDFYFICTDVNKKHVEEIQ